MKKRFVKFIARGNGSSKHDSSQMNYLVCLSNRRGGVLASSKNIAGILFQYQLVLVNIFSFRVFAKIFHSLF